MSRERSPEYRLKISNSLIGNTPGNKGKPITAELRARLSMITKKLYADGVLTSQKISIATKRAMANIPKDKKAQMVEKSKLKVIESYASGKHKNLSKITCTHCSKVGAYAPMHRWHLDNCRRKKLFNFNR
jgi:hypothetical protein